MPRPPAPIVVERIDGGVADGFSGSRREFMKLMAASLALAGAGGCTPAPPDKIVPYVKGQPGLTEGEPLYFATALTRDGYASGVLVASYTGRPTKVEGNPAHPASLGATDIFAQAAVLELWDPDRSQTVLQLGEPSTWEAFLDALRARLRALETRQGEGLHLLTGSFTSPTVQAQLQALRTRLPRSAWHAYRAFPRDSAYEGTRLAFGEAVETCYRFDRAQVVLALDADFLSALPGCVRYARDFAQARRPDPSRRELPRLYAVECAPTLTGAAADHRLALRPADLAAFAQSVAARLGVAPAASNAHPVAPERWLAALVDDLRRHRGNALVLAGDRQPPHVHALAHAINAALGSIGNTVVYTEPVAADAGGAAGTIASLAGAMARGEVDTLVVLGGNPVYDAPADLDFGAALARVPFAAHLGLYADETAVRCQWHVPAAHELESWGDARAFDGTASLQQPLIAPLYGGKTASEMLAALLGEANPQARDIVRRHWQQQRTAGDFERFWDEALRQGLIAGSASAPKRVAIKPIPQAPAETAAAPTQGALTLVFERDPTIDDGRWANNAWLQELPKPMTQLTWDNALLMSAATARARGLANGDVVRLEHRGRHASGPVWIAPGHPDESVTVFLGGGRTRAGRVGNGVGFDAYALRTSEAPWFASGATIERTGERLALATTQSHHRMEGRDLVRSATLAQFLRDPGFAQSLDDPPATQASLYPPFDYGHGHAWAMSIDLGACIGCAACTIACQAENNIPVVGKGEVLRGREMHWIRVDRYDEGPAERPRTDFQPVPCMHCERAPCEVVCPVGATVHDAEGLNVQVYNRCVGTRFCANNCPYQVRRFNFLEYSQDVPALNAQKNPEVSVRMRGVMEKCTYCVQRIANARIVADRENRTIADGDVVTACQAVCPTGAIVFGDLNDPQSAVRKAKSSPLDYALLAELNTRPRTTYLAKVRNTHPELGDE